MSRVRGEYDVPGGYMVWRALTPSQAKAAAKAKADGVKPGALAAEYGVSVRTIYRAIRQATTPHAVGRVGDWWAEFVLTDEGPIRLTPWHSALRPEDVGL